MPRIPIHPGETLRRSPDCPCRILMPECLDDAGISTTGIPSDRRPAPVVTEILRPVKSHCCG